MRPIRFPGNLRAARTRASRTLLLALIALAACVQTNAVLLNPAPVSRPRVPADQVRIYLTPESVKGRYEEIALLNSTGESNMSDEKDMIESMRKKAGDLGANGLILNNIKEASAGAKVAAAVLGTGTQRKGRAVAIWVFSDSTARPDADANHFRSR